MKTAEAVRLSNRISGLFKKIENIEDMELKAQWARYLCVLCCGFLEVSFRAVLVDAATRRSSEEIRNFVEAKLDLSRSPKMGNMIETVALFSKTWSETLERDTAGKIKDSVDSLVVNRHLIAHGQDTGVSYVRVKTWFEDSIHAIEKLEQIVGAVSAR